MSSVCVYVCVCGCGGVGWGVLYWGHNMVNEITPSVALRERSSHEGGNTIKADLPSIETSNSF